jgi:hypothetical protein
VAFSIGTIMDHTSIFIYKRAIRAFNSSAARNTWIVHKNIKVYVRKGQRRLPNTTGFQLTFDVANIEVMAEKGKGVFTEWLGIAEHQARLLGYDAVFVESILEERLIPFLERRGYKHMPGSIPPSMYLLIQRV